MSDINIFVFWLHIYWSNKINTVSINKNVREVISIIDGVRLKKVLDEVILNSLLILLRVRFHLIWKYRIFLLSISEGLGEISKYFVLYMDYVEIKRSWSKWRAHSYDVNLYVNVDLIIVKCYLCKSDVYVELLVSY